jgi:hypothetical protein
LKAYRSRSRRADKANPLIGGFLAQLSAGRAPTAERNHFRHLVAAQPLNIYVFYLLFKKRLHYLICCWCQRYEEQRYYLRETASGFPERVDKSSDERLSPSAKTRIKNKISDLE